MTAEAKEIIQTVEEQVTYLRNNKHKFVEELFEEGKILRFINDYLANEIVGEEQNRLLLWLGLLNKPSQIFVLGDSAVGKTHLVNSVLKTIPDWRIEELGGATENVIKYFLQDIGLNVDIVYMQEYSGQSESQRQQFRLTSGYDGGYNWYVSVPSLEDPRVWTKHKIEVGSLTFITTTAKNIDVQEETRAIAIYPDGSINQSKAIVERSFCDWSKKHIPKDFTFEREVCQAVYEELRDLDLIPVFPYGVDPLAHGLITVPFNTIKVRREKDKLRFITEAITKINHKKRAKFFLDTSKRTHKQGYVLIHLEDLLFAITLLQGQNDGSLTGLSPTEVQYLEVVESILKTALENEAPEPSINSKEVYFEGLRNNLTLAEDTVRRTLNNLAKKGYFIKEPNPSDKRQNIYIYTNKKREFFEIDQEKASASFNEWLENQDEEVQDYLLQSAGEKLEYYRSPIDMNGIRYFIKEGRRPLLSAKEGDKKEENIGMAQSDKNPIIRQNALLTDYRKNSGLDESDKKKATKTPFSQKKGGEDSFTKLADSVVGELEKV